MNCNRRSLKILSPLSFDDMCIWEYKINLENPLSGLKWQKAADIKHMYLKCQIGSVPKQYIVFSPLLCFPPFSPVWKTHFVAPLLMGIFRYGFVPNPFIFDPFFHPKYSCNSLLINVSRCRSVPKQDRRGSRRRSSPCSTMHPLLLLLYAVRVWTSR